MKQIKNGLAYFGLYIAIFGAAGLAFFHMESLRSDIRDIRTEMRDMLGAIHSNDKRITVLEHQRSKPPK